MKVCEWCGTEFTPSRNAGTIQKYCSLKCKNAYGQRFRYSDPMRRTQQVPWQRSPLNDDVDILYAQCDNEHEPSDAYVWRDFYSVTLYIPVCRNCGVPIRGLTKVQAFNRRVA